MAPKKSKNSKKNKTKKPITTSSSSSSSPTLSFEVGNTRLPQTLPGGPYQTNPYQFDGPRNAFEAKTVEGGFYVRIDMPGVKKDLLKVNFENKKLSFSGKAPKGSIYESGPRNYRGDITFTTEAVEVSHFKVDMNNGVLRMVLVGSGFPPDYYAASSHLDRKVPGIPQTCEILNNELLLVFNSSLMLDRPDNFSGMYPFQLDGEKGTYEMRGISDGYCFLRIDMPDVGFEGLSLKLSDRKMVYGGTGVKASEYDESKRLYFGSLVMHCPCDCRLVEMNGGISDGVVRLLIKKVRVKATQRIGHTSYPTAGPRLEMLNHED